MNMKRINGISNSDKQTGCYTPLCIKKQWCGGKNLHQIFFLVLHRIRHPPSETSLNFLHMQFKKKERIKSSSVKIVNALDILCPLLLSCCYVVALANLQSFYLLCPFCSTWSKDSSLSLPTFEAGLELTKSFICYFSSLFQIKLLS